MKRKRAIWQNCNNKHFDKQQKLLSLLSLLSFSLPLSAKRQKFAQICNCHRLSDCLSGEPTKSLVSQSSTVVVSSRLCVFECKQPEDALLSTRVNRILIWAKQGLPTREDAAFILTTDHRLVRSDLSRAKKYLDCGNIEIVFYI